MKKCAQELKNISKPILQFDREKLKSIIQNDINGPEIEQQCEFVVVLVTIFKIKDAARNILQVRKNITMNFRVVTRRISTALNDLNFLFRNETHFRIP